MHSNSSEYDSEFQVPTKKIKLSPELSKTKEAFLSKLLFKEIQQEINLRKEDLELIEDNIFLVRQKLLHLKQVLAADFYQQKNVKGFLQYPPHPAVKDTLVGKSPSTFHNYKLNNAELEHEAIKLQLNVKNEIEGIATNENELKACAVSDKLLEDENLPCYIAPKIPDNVVKITEPRDCDSKKEIRIVVGNVSKWLAPSEASDATHKWTVYAKIAEPDQDISLFVYKVVFFLHRSYRPNDVIEVKNPPFKLTRRGWGEFPLKTQFHFKTPDPPVDVMHNLKLDHVHSGFETFGAETSLAVWVHCPVERVDNNKDRLNEFPTVKNDCNDFDSITEIDKCKVEQLLNRSKGREEINLTNSSITDELLLNSFDIDDYFKNEKNVDFGDELKQEQLCDPEFVSSFDGMKYEKLVSPSLKVEDSSNIDQNLLKEKHNNEKKLYSSVNNSHESQLRNEEKVSLTYFSKYETDELFTDECAVVGEEVVIDCDEADYSNNNEFNSEKEKHNVLDDCYLENSGNVAISFLNDSKPKDCLNHIEQSIDSPKQLHENDSVASSSLSCAALGLGIVSSGVEKPQKKVEMTPGVGENKSVNGIICDEIPTINCGQKLNNLTGSSNDYSEVITGEILKQNSSKRLKKKTEKKAMVITLQKENGQIILRKEAKIKKCKDNSSHKKGSNTLEKEVTQKNQPILNSKVNIEKPVQTVIDVKKHSLMKLVLDEQLKLSPIHQSGSGQESVFSIAVQKRHLPEVDLLKKVKKDKEACEDSESSDLLKRCPIQNTEIAINWLMKKFPLVDARAVNPGFHSIHPYCAKDRETFLKWPFAKQRAGELMRAKAIGRLIKNIHSLKQWTTLEILDWARIRCYTPMKNVPDYNGPTIEPEINFVYKPRIDKIMEFIDKHRMLTEEEEVDVVSLDVPNKDKKSSGNPESCSTSHWIPNEYDTVLPLDPELQGYKSFIDKCMINSVDKSPSCELLVPGVAYPAVERVLISVFSSISEELIRRSYNASWIRHCDNPPPEISVLDVKTAIVSRKEFDFLLPLGDRRGREQPSIISPFSQ